MHLLSPARTITLATLVLFFTLTYIAPAEATPLFGSFLKSDDDNKSEAKSSTKASEPTSTQLHTRSTVKTSSTLTSQTTTQTSVTVSHTSSVAPTATPTSSDKNSTQNQADDQNNNSTQDALPIELNIEVSAGSAGESGGAAAEPAPTEPGAENAHTVETTNHLVNDTTHPDNSTSPNPEEHKHAVSGGTIAIIVGVVILVVVLVGGALYCWCRIQSLPAKMGMNVAGGVMDTVKQKFGRG